MDLPSFLAELTTDGLLERPLVDALALDAPTAKRASAEVFAQWLVEQRYLTRFQATNILRGNATWLMLGDLEIRSYLGRGGMGTVYLAHDRVSGKFRAVKVMPAGRRANERSVRRFEREMTVSQRLSHPALAATHGTGVKRGVPYMVMEFVPGRTLYRLVRRHGPVSAYWAAKWGAEAASALDYAHQRGVIHRDLKPSNLMITPEQRAVLLDLGLARWYDDDHNEDQVLGPNRVVGSFDYISPEQAANAARADSRSDLYGLGCLLYFALAGKAPFQHVESRADKVHHHREVDPTPLKSIRSDVPRGLARVIAKLMAKSPSDRYAVADEVREVLDRWTTQLAPTTHVDPPPVFLAPVETPSTEEPIPVDDPAGIDVEAMHLRSRAWSENAGAQGAALWERLSGSMSRWWKGRSVDPGPGSSHEPPKDVAS